MEQQRPLLYLMLAFITFMIWSSWQSHNQPQQQVVATTANTAQVNQAQGAAVPNVPASQAADLPAMPTNTAQPSNATPANDAGMIRVKTDVLDVLISLRGGTVVQSDLLTYPIGLEDNEKNTPVRVLDQNVAYAAQSGIVSRNGNAEHAPSHHAVFTASANEYVLQDSQDALDVKLNWVGADGINAVKTFRFTRGKFLIDVEQTLNNLSSEAWEGMEYQQLTHGVAQEKGGMLGAVSYTGGAYWEDKYVKVDFGDIQDENLQKPIVGGWAAMLKHYFVSAWVPGPEQTNNYYTKYIPASANHILGLSSPILSVPAGKAGTFKSQLYTGPKTQAELEKISPGLDLTVDYGIFAFVSKPIFWMMTQIHSVVKNWGWTIILMTILIKILFFWPSAVSYRSMAKMKKLAPKIKAINDKHKSDPQAKQKATMDFYRKEKINPLGGCLPILIQMPVFMGLYWVLLESVELRQAPWIMWFKDLSVMDPFYVLPILMGLSMWIQQKLNPPQMVDPMQQKIFQFLPLVFTVMFLFFPAGLVLYWVVNNVLSIAQQWFITKKIVGDSAPVLS